MALIKLLNDLANCIESGTDDQELDRLVDTIWYEANNDVNRDRYIYSGPIFIAEVIRKECYNNPSEIIEEYADFSLALTSEIHAESSLRSKLLNKSYLKGLFSTDESRYTGCILSGTTNCGVKVAPIMEDNVDKMCLWDFMNYTIYRNTYILLKPGAIENLHIIK